MMSVTVYIVVGIIFLIGICNAATIPSYIHTCHRSDPEVNKCILDAVEVIRPKLKDGIPELNVPPVEPFTIKRLEVIRAREGRHFQLELKDIDVYGISDFEVDHLKLDMANYIFKMQVRVPMLRLIGTYDVDAKILAFPLKGSGKVDANATNGHGTGILKGEVVQRNGIPIMQFTDLTMDLHVDDYSIKLDGMFGGDKTLTEAVNQLINQNKAELIKLATPVIAEEASKVILDLLNKATQDYNFDEVFPE